LRGALTLAAVLAAIFVAYTWLVIHWGPFIHLDDLLNRNYHVKNLFFILGRLDRIGQRAVCLPILAVVVAVTAWRHRSWRPALLAAIAVFSVNLLVLIAKLAMSRGHPISGRGFFTWGDMYPSGHTANTIVVYGLCFHLISHYGQVSARTKRILLGVVCALCVVMTTTSLTLQWHWFSDLVGGFLVGGTVLALTVGIDAALPFRSHRLVVLPVSEPVAEPAASPASPRPLEPAELAPADSPVGAPAAGRSQPEQLSLRRTSLGSPPDVAGRRFRH